MPLKETYFKNSAVEMVLVGDSGGYEWGELHTYIRHGWYWVNDFEVGGRHSKEVAFALLTQQPRI